MSLPKKKSRKITVGNTRYGWIATGNDGWIDLAVASMEHKGQLLTAVFAYHHNTLEHFNKDGTLHGWGIRQRLVITPIIVKQVIEYGLTKGWKPLEPGLPFHLGHMDNKIDLHLKDEIKYPYLINEQVTLNFAELTNSTVLKTNRTSYTDGGEIYLIFNSLEEAKEYAIEATAKYPDIECWIRQGRENAVSYVSNNEIKDF